MPRWPVIFCRQLINLRDETTYGKGFAAKQGGWQTTHG